MDMQTVIALCAIFTVVIEIVRLTDREKWGYRPKCVP
jgi:hypothetical protein